MICAASALRRASSSSNRVPKPLLIARLGGAERDLEVVGGGLRVGAAVGRSLQADERALDVADRAAQRRRVAARRLVVAGARGDDVRARARRPSNNGRLTATGPMLQVVPLNERSGADVEARRADAAGERDARPPLGVAPGRCRRWRRRRRRRARRRRAAAPAPRPGRYGTASARRLGQARAAARERGAQVGLGDAGQRDQRLSPSARIARPAA